MLFSIHILFYVTILFTIKSLCLRLCDTESYSLNYFKIKSCYKSNFPIIGWKNVNNLKDCMDFVKDRKGLAFNFSPPEAINYTKGYFRNCQALGCPETSNASLEMDFGFDYYSAYGNFSTLNETICIKSEGIFKLSTTLLNYTDSFLECQNSNGDLANILSETRTNTLAYFIKNQITDWYKAAYVGLDDMYQEGLFENAFGSFLGCSRYRAWAPGHPRSKHNNEDCVILDSDRTWRVIDCNIKLRAICELFPHKPEVGLNEIQFKNVSCHKIKNKKKKKLCKKQKELWNLMRNSSRLDQCALNDL